LRVLGRGTIEALAEGSADTNQKAKQLLFTSEAESTVMSVDESVDWDAVAAMRASPRRRQVLEQLVDGPKHAAEIARALEYACGTISKDFWWMKGRSPPLIVCLTPDRPHHVLYALTDEGMAVVEHM
jgi:hypothetical protein